MRFGAGKALAIARRRRRRRGPRGRRGAPAAPARRRGPLALSSRRAAGRGDAGRRRPPRRRPFALRALGRPDPRPRHGHRRPPREHPRGPAAVGDRRRRDAGRRRDVDAGLRHRRPRRRAPPARLRHLAPVVRQALPGRGRRPLAGRAGHAHDGSRLREPRGVPPAATGERRLLHLVAARRRHRVARRHPGDRALRHARPHLPHAHRRRHRAHHRSRDGGDGRRRVPRGQRADPARRPRHAGHLRRGSEPARHEGRDVRLRLSRVRP